MGEHTLSAGTSDKRMYWLSQLQRARREFSQAGAAAAARSSMSCQVFFIVFYSYVIYFLGKDKMAVNITFISGRSKQIYLMFYLMPSSQFDYIFL